MKRKTDLNGLVFRHAASVAGMLYSSFVFKTVKEFERWREKDLPRLEEQYGPLKLRDWELPGLKVGDECVVVGEGTDVFVIEEVVYYSPNRYGFALNSGWREEVNKCYKPQD